MLLIRVIAITVLFIKMIVMPMLLIKMTMMLIMLLIMMIVITMLLIKNMYCTACTVNSVQYVSNVYCVKYEKCAAVDVLRCIVCTVHCKFAMLLVCSMVHE